MTTLTPLTLFVLKASLLFWGFGKSHRSACERVSDLTAAELVQDRQQYAASLLNIASRVSSPPEFGMSVARSPMVLSRLKTIASGITAQRLGRKGLAAAGAAILATVVVGTTALVAVRQAAAVQQDKMTTTTAIVLDASGKPAAGALVEVRLESGELGQSLETDALGQFSYTVPSQAGMRTILVVRSADGEQVAYANSVEMLVEDHMNGISNP